jgi:hypothetical protein
MINIENQNDLEVYQCAFEVHVQKATMVVKFPCLYSIEIKTMTKKNILAVTKQKVSAVNSVAIFNETLRFDTELLYNCKERLFAKKEVLLLLNLVSIRRPEQVKLVGRVTIDLSEVMQAHYSSQLKNYKLDYCSVNACVTFSMRLCGKQLSETLPDNFDGDSNNDFEVFISELHKDSIYKKKGATVEEAEKTLDMPWRSRGSSVVSRNKIVEESYHEEGESNGNAGVGAQKVLPQDDNIMKPEPQPLN